MDQLVVVVHMLIRKGRADEAVAAFVPAIKRAQEEPGCDLCALHRDVHDPDVLVLISRWDSEEDRETILHEGYVHELTEKVSPLLAEVPTITVSKALSIGQGSKSLL